MGSTPDILSSVDINLTLVGIGAVVFILILYGIFSAILVYHWRAYAIGQEIIRRTLRAYFISTGILFAVAVLLVFFL